MVRVGCAFRKPVNFKNGYSVDVILSKRPVVMINDIDKDWSLPCGLFDEADKFLWQTKDVGNPKMRRMDMKDFKKTFKITSLTTQRGRYPFEKGKKNKLFYVRLFIDNKIFLPIIQFVTWLR